MLAGIRFVRRIGLAVGAWFFVYFLAHYAAYAWSENPSAVTYALAMSIGAAILAFFLPGVEASSFTEKEI